MPLSVESGLKAHEHAAALNALCIKVAHRFAAKNSQRMLAELLHCSESRVSQLLNPEHPSRFTTSDLVVLMAIDAAGEIISGLCGMSGGTFTAKLATLVRDRRNLRRVLEANRDLANALINSIDDADTGEVSDSQERMFRRGVGRWINKGA